MTKPLVSVLIATYNRADLIGAAIESVQKQTFTQWELIVHDDASTDGTDKVVERYIKDDERISYVRQHENVGISRNRNSGLAAARGAYIAILDSDDVWLDPTKLEKQVAFLESHPGYALVGTQVVAIDAHGEPAGKFSYETDNAAIRAKMLRRNQFTQSSVMYRAEAAREAGLYDPALAINEDYDLWLKIGARHTVANLPEYMTGYRIHPGGVTKMRRIYAAETHLSIIRAHKSEYPGYHVALIKAYLRILVAVVGL